MKAKIENGVRLFKPLRYKGAVITNISGIMSTSQDPNKSQMILRLRHFIIYWYASKIIALSLAYA